MTSFLEEAVQCASRVESSMNGLRAADFERSAVSIADLPSST